MGSNRHPRPIRRAVAERRRAAIHSDEHVPAARLGNHHSIRNVGNRSLCKRRSWIRLTVARSASAEDSLQVHICCAIEPIRSVYRPSIIDASTLGNAPQYCSRCPVELRPGRRIDFRVREQIPALDVRLNFALPRPVADAFRIVRPEKARNASSTSDAYIRIARPCCLTLLKATVRYLLHPWPARTQETRSRRIAMIAMTTRSSIRVNALCNNMFS